MSALLAALFVVAPPAFQSGEEPASAEARAAELEAARARIVVPEGCSVSLFAAEPLLANPVAFDVDDSGRVYVAETYRLHDGVTDLRDHMDWLEDELQTRTVADRLAMFERRLGAEFATYDRASERVRRVVDENGDGRADGATVFAEGFDDPAAGVGAGLLACGPNVYYACIPDLLRLADRDGDGVAEERAILSTGYGVNVAMIGHDLHGLTLGWDGRLYFSCGDRGFTVLTEDGVIQHVDAGAVLRCELDGSGLEVWHTGLRNPQELAFDDLGNLFTGDNNSDSGDRARLVHVVEGGDSGWRYSYQWIEGTWRRGPWNDEKLWHPHHAGQAAYVVPPIANHGAGPSGLAAYPGTGLPPEYQGTFFLCDFTGSPTHSSVHALRFLRRGASFELGEVERFLSGVLATDVDFAPDGALLVSDWVEGWTTTGKGRIWRVVHDEGTRVPVARETQRLLADGMEHRHVDELRALLAHADRRVRLNAQLALAGRGSDGYRVLAEVAERGTDRMARVHAIWGLGVLRRREPPHRARILDAAGTAVDPLDPLVGLLADYDPEIRAQAVRVLGDARPDWIRGIGHQVIARVADSSPRARFFASIACGRSGLEKAVPRLVDVLRSTEDTDTDLRHAAIVGLAGCASTEDLVALAGDRSPHVRIGAAVALRRKRDPAVARFLADEDPLVVVEAARALHDLDELATSEGLDALGALAERIEREPALRSPAIVRRVLCANDRLGEERHARRVFDFAMLADTDERLRAEAIRILAEWPDARSLDRVHGRWAPRGERKTTFRMELANRLSALLEQEPVSERVWMAYVDLVRSTAANLDEENWPEGDAAFRSGATRLMHVLRSVLGHDRASSAVRVAAFEAGVAHVHSTPSRFVEDALDHRDGEVRAAALRWLERNDPARVRTTLAEALTGGELAERRAALEKLAADRSDEASALLGDQLEALLRGTLPAELALDVVQACEGREDERINELLGVHSGRRSSDPELGPWLDALLGGDPDRGRKLFEGRPDLACTRCHATRSKGEEGFGIGPNLAGVAERVGRLGILESIVAPNRTTTRGYDTTAVVVDGDLVVGRVVEEDGARLTLLDANGETTVVLKKEIESRKQDLSAMPNGLAELLSPREMRDLIEYLARL